MAKTKSKDDLMALILLGGAGVGGYFVYKYFKKDEGKKGFIRVSSPLPSEAEGGETINVTIFGKNTTSQSHLCFVKIVNQETTNLLAPRQTAQVNAGLSRQFDFSFEMPFQDLRLEIQTGRIIDSQEIIDSKYPKTIKSLGFAPLDVTSVGIVKV